MIRRIVVVAALVLTTSAAFGQFEGEATFKVTTRRDKSAPLEGTAHMFSSKTGFRMEWEMATGATGQAGPAEIKMVILARLPNPEKIYMVNDANRTYSVWDTKKAREDGKNAPKDTYTVQKLGMDRVGGYACQNARVTSSKGTVFDVCVAREFGASSDWLAAMNHNSPESGSWLKSLRDAGIEGSPVRWSVRSKGAAEPKMIMELVRADRKALAATLFEVPAGYKETGFAMGGLTPEQEKAMGDARARMQESLKDMTPEQRKQYEETMKRYAPTPAP